MLLMFCCRQYKIYDLAHPSYTLLYTIPAAGISEVKLSSAYLVAVRQLCSKSHRPLQAQTTIQSTDSNATSQQLGAEAGHPSWTAGDPPAKPSSSNSNTADCDYAPHGQQVVAFEVLSAVNGQVNIKQATTCSSLPVLHQCYSIKELYARITVAKFSIAYCAAARTHESLYCIPGCFLHPLFLAAGKA